MSTSRRHCSCDSDKCRVFDFVSGNTRFLNIFRDLTANLQACLSTSALAISHQLIAASSASELIRLLFSTKGVDWIHICCAQRGNDTCNDRDKCQQRSSSSESYRVPWF